MIEKLSKKKCFNHSKRQASAKCLNCSHFFCPECITEHNGRLSCSNCLQKESEEKEKSGSKLLGTVLLTMSSFAAFIFICLFFYIFARLLYSSPEDFHQYSMDDAYEKPENEVID